MPGMHWRADELARLAALREHMRPAAIAALMHRSRGSVYQQLHRMRKAGVVPPSTVARTRTLRPEERVIWTMYRRKRFAAHEAFAALERAA